MTVAHKKIWFAKVGNSVACGPKLASLPPTAEALKENVAHAHLQVARWKKTMEEKPPA